MFSLLLAIIYMAFISLGLPDGLLGAAWPSMVDQFQVPLSFAGNDDGNDAGIRQGHLELTHHGGPGSAQQAIRQTQTNKSHIDDGKQK